MPMMGYREYARHRGCSLRAVQKAIDDGRIKLVPDGGRKPIDSDQADRDWRDNTDPGRQSVLLPPGPAAAGQTSAHAAGGDDDDAPQPGDNDRYRLARAEREEIKRDRERLDLEVERGNLIALDMVSQLAYTEFRRLRDGVLNVPARVNNLLAAMTDPMEIELLLERELSAVLTAFSVARITAEPDDDEDDD